METRWNWADDVQDAFIYIKEQLILAPILASPDFSKPCIVQTVILSQESNGSELVICYANRSLTKAEQIFSTTEKE